MKKTVLKLAVLVMLIGYGLLQTSCESKDSIKEELTFESIEAEFGFAKALPESSRKKILDKFSSLEEYRNYLIDVMKEKSKQSNK